MSLILDLLVSLVLTVMIEELVGFFFGIHTGRKRLLVLLVNLLTNPAVVYLSLTLQYEIPDLNEYIIELPLEMAAFITEAVVYRSFAQKKGYEIAHPVLFAAVANFISYGTGYLIF